MEFETYMMVMCVNVRNCVSRPGLPKNQLLGGAVTDPLENMLKAMHSLPGYT